jgi:hypothetical protein
MGSFAVLRETAKTACRRAWFFALACMFVCPSAFAADFSVFGGTEMGGRGQGFSYTAIDATQKINNVISLSARVMPSYLTYKYYSGDTLIKAVSPGVNAVGGVKISWGRTSLSVLAGAETRDTTLHPDDRYASVRGHSTAGVVQGEFDTWVAKGTNLNVFANYSGTSDFTYEKGRVKQQVSNLDSKKPYTFYAGVEQFLGRNTDFSEQGVGPVVEFIYMPQKLSIAVIGGYKHDSTFGNGMYWGLRVYKGF